MATQHYETDTSAAIVRGMLKTHIRRKEAESYAKLIFEALHIKGRNKMGKLIQALQEDDNIEILSEMVKDSTVLYEFVEGFIGTDSYQECLLDRCLRILTSGVLTEIEDESITYYLETPSESFETLEEDFRYAGHLSFLSILKRSRFNPSPLMFLCENIDTGLIALKYFISPTEADSSQSEKILILNAEEIDTSMSGGNFSTESFFRGSLGFQGVGRTDNDVPWWLKNKNVPIAVIIKQTSSLSDEFVKKLELLGKDREFYVLAETGANGAGRDEVDFHFGCDINSFLEEISFTLNYDGYEVNEPATDSAYMERVFRDLAIISGCKIHEDLKISDILAQLKKNREKAKAWEGNTSVERLVNKVISTKQIWDSEKILKPKDFEFLRTGLMVIKNQSEKDREQKRTMSAWERMNHSIFGLHHVKKEMMDAIKAIAVNKQRDNLGLPSSKINNVFAFYGPPGVGKTEMAKHFGEIMKEEGFLSSGRFININGAQLKGMYVGQTAPKIAAIFASHDIIFIDECYSLAATHNSMDTYSQEALAELCVQLEKHGKDKLIIFAGYGGSVEDKKNKMMEFLDANPGLSSRITFHVDFPQYTIDEMLGIFRSMADNEKYRLEEGWETVISEFVSERSKEESFGNARDARKLFQHAIKSQIRRIADRPLTVDVLRSLNLEDIRNAINNIKRGELNLAGNPVAAIGF